MQGIPKLFHLRLLQYSGQFLIRLLAYPATSTSRLLSYPGCLHMQAARTFYLQAMSTARPLSRCNFQCSTPQNNLFASASHPSRCILVLCHTTPGLAFSVDMSLDSVESIELSSPYLQAFGLSSLYLQALAETMPMRNNDELHRQFTDVGRASATKKLVRSLRQLANDVSEAYSRRGGLVQNLSDAVEVWHSLYFIFEVTVCLTLGPFPSMSRNVLILLLALCY
jgi:hypothetical protein